MLATVYSGTTLGLKGILVEVETDVAGRGFPTFTIVGLPNKAVDEAKERVRTAISNSGFEMPDSRITVNLAPADVPKSGSAFDLAMALGILCAQGLMQPSVFANKMIIGELSLHGEVRKINGIIPLLILAKEQGIKEVFIPEGNAEEATLIPDLYIYTISNLRQVAEHLMNGTQLKPASVSVQSISLNADEYGSDFSRVHGQEQAKRVLEIAAAGFHNVHLMGTPGAGKTMLSRTFSSILPALTPEEILEVAKIYSVVGELKVDIFHGRRPFRAPHHTTSRNGLIGGGSVPMPGEISLAHRGVLFLDEFPEFPRNTLEALRQPIEDGLVTISRAAGSLTYPARFLLLAASNPCPCGFAGHPKKQCVCPPGMILKYQKRLSGPLLDRIDLHITVPPVEVEKLTQAEKNETSETVRARVIAARERQQSRFRNTRIHFNSEMSSADVRTFCILTDEAKILLKQAVDRLSLSARSYFKIIKVAQTIADLSSLEYIDSPQIAEALQYRSTT